MDIVLTWPKKVPYKEYVEQLIQAEREGKTILFKVSAFPSKAQIGDRCYMVHDGKVRGFSLIQEFDGAGMPDAVRDGDQWTRGKYIVRSPEWHELLNPPAMKGFQGFRYADPEWRKLTVMKQPQLVRVV